MSPPVQEMQDLSSSHKQAAAVHGSKEVRLNRALEEVDKLRTQLHRMKQMNKVSKSAFKDNKWFIRIIKIRVSKNRLSS